MSFWGQRNKFFLYSSAYLPNSTHEPKTMLSQFLSSFAKLNFIYTG